MCVSIYDCKDGAFLAEGFKETDDPDRYFTAFVDGYLKEMEVEDSDLSEELLRYITFRGWNREPSPISHD